MEKFQNKKRLKIGLFSLLGLVLAGGLVFAGCKLRQRQVQPVPTVIPTPLPTLTPELAPTPTSDPTADWKTYQSSNFNFSIKYPTNWRVSFPEAIERSRVKEITTVVTFYGQQGQFLAVSVDPFVRSFDDLWLRYSKFSMSNAFADTTLGGLPAKKVTLWNPQAEDSPLPTYSTYSEEYLVNHADFLWRVDYPARDENGSHDEIFDLMLSTFKFLE